MPFILYEVQTFIFLNPSKESGIKSGYYMQLSEGEKTKLFCKIDYSTREKQTANTFGIITIFDRKVRYYLLYNNQYYNMKNAGSFSKIFPQYKKQINQYAKDRKLNFRNNTELSLYYLAEYCEELLTSRNN